MNSAFDRRRTWQENLGVAPPDWAVFAVKFCVIGMLALPLGVTLALVALSAFGVHGPVGAITMATSAVVWVAMFVTAQVLITRYPPVPRGAAARARAAQARAARAVGVADHVGAAPSLHP